MLDLLEVVAEPNRRKLLQLLTSGEKSVSELAADFSVSRSAISQQLLLLLEARLISVRKHGRNRFYAIEPAGMARLKKFFLDEFWSHELDQLVTEAQAIHSKRTGR
ncbi:MAG: metalloregulator ArsR/SmtB family transcription factor [Actinomycetes bacterium]